MNMQNNLPAVKIISLTTASLSFLEQVELILNWAQKKESRVVCCANVHMVVEAYKDKQFRADLKRADLITPDGMPLVWYIRKKAKVNQERVAGMDLLPALCREAAENNLKVFFLGSTKQTLEAIKQRLGKEYAGLKSVGFLSPPFESFSSEVTQKIINQINKSGAHLVFVSLGCPKQEKWMLANKGKVNSVMLGVGAAFPVFAGIQRRAPLWMQKSGLEWLYRLLREPKRLFKRYLTTNARFLFLIVAENLGLLDLDKEGNILDN